MVIPTKSKSLQQRGLLRMSSTRKIDNNKDDTSNSKSCSDIKMNNSSKNNGATKTKTLSTEVFLQLQFTLSKQNKKQPRLVLKGVKCHKRPPPLPKRVNSEPTFNTQEQFHDRFPIFLDGFKDSDIKVKCDSSSVSETTKNKPKRKHLRRTYSLPTSRNDSTKNNNGNYRCANSASSHLMMTHKLTTQSKRNGTTVINILDGNRLS